MLTATHECNSFNDASFANKLMKAESYKAGGLKKAQSKHCSQSQPAGSGTTQALTDRTGAPVELCLYVHSI